jgi:hypothetical protein
MDITGGNRLKFGVISKELEFTACGAGINK